MKLTDLSSRLGVSVSTVSRALRNAEGVDTQTRTRVLAEAARAGYRGPGRQRLVRAGKTRTMLALSRNDAVSVSHDAMAGMSQAAIELNVSIVTHQTSHEAAGSILNPRLQPPALRSGQVDGIVLLNEWPASVVAELQQTHPVVSMLYDYPGCDVVGVDEWEGMRDLASRIGGAGPLGYFGASGGGALHSRLRGAFEALAAGGGDLPVVDLPGGGHPGEHPPKPDVEVFSRHFRGGVHAWICPDALSAEALSECARALGHAEQASLRIGVFHPSSRASSGVGWTSLEIPGEELGIAAVRRLLHRIDHPSEAIRRISLRAGLPSADAACQPIPSQPH